MWCGAGSYLNHFKQRVKAVLGNPHVGWQYDTYM